MKKVRVLPEVCLIPRPQSPSSEKWGGGGGGGEEKNMGKA